MRFSSGLLDEIRARLPLSEVVGRRVSWDRRKTQPGRGDFWACCPFHQEKTPSFHVDDRRGRYKCFGCGASGDHFRFITETEGLSFPEAVERLAGETGVALPKADPRAEQRERERAGLAEICELAARFFQAEFATSGGSDARAYCERRGLKPQTLKEFRFGFAPNSRDALKRHLLGKGVDEEAMIEAGLVIRPDDGRPAYDRFRNRLIIPIEDERGRVVAFGGRTLDPDGQPKYLNSPETPLFHKGTMLFNLHRAREAAFRSGQAIVVEGYMDAIAIWQAGLPAVVAALGTAFTEEQIARMWRLTPEPVVCFDGDAAGRGAAYRALDRILPGLRSGHSFNFAFLDAGMDPDDLIRAQGVAAFRAVMEKAQPAIDVLWERETAGTPVDTPERKAALEKRLDDLAGQIRDERVRRRYQLEIRIRLSNLFYEQVRQGRSNDRRGRARGGRADADAGAWSGPPQPVGDQPMFGTERILCGLLLKYPDLFERHLDRVSQVGFSNELHRRFRDELCRIATDLAEVRVSDFFDKLDERFYQILAEAFATTHDDNGAVSQAPGVQHLIQRLPILGHAPPPDYVEALFVHFLDLLETKALERELEHEMSGVGEDLDETAWERIRLLSQELARRREECARDDQDLADRGRKLKAARGASGGARDGLQRTG